MTPSGPQQTSGFTSALLKAIQTVGDASTHSENKEAALEQARHALRSTPGAASSHQVATLFSLGVQLAEGAKNTFDSYNSLIDLGKELLRVAGLWPSTQAYINSELARCCVSLILMSTTYEGRCGYHRALHKYVSLSLNDLEKLSAAALKSSSNREVPKVVAQALAFSAAFQDGSATPRDIHSSFWENLRRSEQIAQGTKSVHQRLLLQLARMLICRSETPNTKEQRDSWVKRLDSLVELAKRAPFNGSLHIITRGYQHLAAISHLVKDKGNTAAAALGIAAALEQHPDFAPTRDNYLSLAYEAQCAIGNDKGADAILTKCRQLNVQGRFDRTARLRLFAARRALDPEPEALLSEGAIYAELFRSVTAPTTESNEVSFKVAKLLILNDAGKFTVKVRALADLCQNQTKFRLALADSVRLLVTSLAREDLMAPYMATLAPLRPVLPDSHKSLLAIISIRQLIKTGRIEEATQVAKLELRTSPQGEENYLREDLHLITAILYLSSGKLRIAESHLRRVPEVVDTRSETLTRRALLRQTLEFICAFRKGETDRAISCYGSLVESFRWVRSSPIFTPPQLANSVALATAIQGLVQANALYEAFESARLGES